jgi:hypothetical protein
MEGIINTLKFRADSFAKRRGSDEDKAYLDLIGHLGGSTPAQQQNQQGQQSGEITEEQLKEFKQCWPLFRNRIDVTQIENFIKFYKKLTGDTSIDYANEAINKAKTTYRLGSQVLGTQGKAEILQRLILLHTMPELKPDSSIDFYINDLRTIAGAAYTGIGNLETRYQSGNSPANRELLEYIRQQQSFYAQNVSDLDQLKQQDFNSAPKEVRDAMNSLKGK